MFRVKASEVTAAYTRAEQVVRIALLVALMANMAVAGLLLHQFVLLNQLPASAPGPALEILQHEVRLQFIVTLLVSAILAFCLLAFWWFLRRYSTSQQSLRQVKILAHDILASMDQGVVTTDLTGVITSINSAALQLLGVDFECAGQPLACISSADLPLVELAKEVSQRQESVQDRRFAVNRSGRVQRFQADAHVLKDTQGTGMGYVIHLRDVTERMLMEERMRRMERFISLGALASGLHHEIKNPLTALSIHIQLLEEHLSESGSAEPIDELVGVLKSEVVRLNGVLESFRNFANLQHLNIHPTDVLALLENTIRLVRPQARQQYVEIGLQHPESGLPSICLDPNKFEQALLNLVINALEAMPYGGRLTVSAMIQGDSLRVEIADTGPGIPPDLQPSLFEPYFSTKEKGTGMGLALSEKLISQHGGRIDYQTGPQGTTFCISVPLENRNGTP